MGPQEAYEELIRFARARGEGALRLAMHAAVPQTFRPELLHLLRLNFLGREFHSPSVEADVLFSPLCEDLGGGYFQFDPQVRTLLLDNLATTYAGEARLSAVANFVLAYIEQQERAGSGSLGRLWRDYLEMQRWTALAFRDPDSAAAQLAAALEGASTGGDYAARFQIGGLASALAAPLVRHRRVLDYAAALQALESGEVERAQDYFRELGDEEISVGGVKLRPVSDVLTDWRARHPDAPLPAQPEPLPAAEEEDDGEPPILLNNLFVFIIYHEDDSELANPIVRDLMLTGLQYAVYTVGAGPARRASVVQRTSNTRATLQREGRDVVAYIFFQTQSYSQGELVEMLIETVTSASCPVVVARLDPQAPQLSELGRGVSYVDMTDADGWLRLLRTLERIQQEEKEVRRAQGEAVTSTFDEVERLLATLREDESEQSRAAAAEEIGKLENPSLLQHLLAALKDPSALVRRAAVRGLARVKTDYVLPGILEATRDADEDVRRAASEALRFFGETMIMLLGRFTPERKAMLDLVRAELRGRGYFPVMFDFEKPPSLSLTEVSVTLAQHSRFLIADLTDPTNVPYELQAIVPQNRVPVQPVIHEQSRPFSFFEDIQRYSWVLPLVTYHSPEDLLANLQERIIVPAEAKLIELREEPPTKARKEPSQKARPAPAVKEPPALDYHVYISHSHPDAQFTRRLLAEFERALAERLGYQPSIFFDLKSAQPTYAFLMETREVLKRSAALISILSPAYFQSADCMRDLNDFRLHAERTGGLNIKGHSRLFGVLRAPVEHKRLPREFQRQPLYSFFSFSHAGPDDVSESVNPDMPDAKYLRVIDQLAQDVSRLLSDMNLTPEEPAARRTKAAKRKTAEPRAKTAKARNQLLICYSHKDKVWLDRFRVVLKPLTRDNPLSVLDDMTFGHSSTWRDELEKALASAKVAVLLVSANFFDSHFYYKNELELPSLLKAAVKAGLTVIPVTVSPSLFQRSPLANYQAASDPAKPLSMLRPAMRQRELHRICKLIGDAMLR